MKKVKTTQKKPKGLRNSVDCFAGREGALPLACKGT